MAKQFKFSGMTASLLSRKIEDVGKTKQFLFDTVKKKFISSLYETGETKYNTFEYKGDHYLLDIESLEYSPLTKEASYKLQNGGKVQNEGQYLFGSNTAEESKPPKVDTNEIFNSLSNKGEVYIIEGTKYIDLGKALDILSTIYSLDSISTANG